MASDPWLSSSVGCEFSKKFEDDFVEERLEKGNLPDSAEYIASLERRLQKIKRGKNQTPKEILRSLEEKRKDCMVRLLAEDFGGLELSPEEDLPTKWIKSHINPQQPLTVGELVELVKADYLAKTAEQADISETEEGAPPS